MKTASVADMESHFSAYLKASQQEPVIVTRKGKPVAVLQAAADKDELERLVMGHSPELEAILAAARQRFREGAGIPHERFWKEVEQESMKGNKKRSTPRKKGPRKSKGGGT